MKISTSMRFAIFLRGGLLYLFLSAGMHAQDAASASPQVALITATLALDKNAIMQGEPVYATVTVKNNSPKEREFFSILLTATGGDGKAVAGLEGYEAARLGTAYGVYSWPFCPLGGGDIARFWFADAPTLPPGGERTERILLPGNFSQPGDYTITARCRFICRILKSPPAPRGPVTAPVSR